MFTADLVQVPGYSFSRASSGWSRQGDGSLQAFAAGVPRITDRGYLCEEPRTQLFRDSNDLTKHTNSSVGIIQTATTIVEDTSDAAHYKQFTVGGTTAGVVQTISGEVEPLPGGAPRNFYFRMIGSTATAVSGTLNLANGTWTMSSSAATYAVDARARLIVPFVAKWLWSITYTPDATIGPHSVRYGISNTVNSALETRVGDGVSGLSVTNSQIEDGAFPSSRIVAGANAVSRAADVLQFNNQAIPAGAYAMLAEFEMPIDTSAGRVIDAANLAAGGRVYIIASTTISIRVISTDGSGTTSAASAAKQPGTIQRVAVVKSGDDHVLYVGGVLVGTVTRGSMPATFDTVSIGKTTGGGASYFNSYIRFAGFRQWTAAEAQAWSAAA